MVWMHVKILRLFVESVLRYGLPVDFSAALVQPKKGQGDAVEPGEAAGHTGNIHITLLTHHQTAGQVSAHPHTPRSFYLISR